MHQKTLEDTYGLEMTFQNHTDAINTITFLPARLVINRVIEASLELADELEATQHRLLIGGGPGASSICRSDPIPTFPMRSAMTNRAPSRNKVPTRETSSAPKETPYQEAQRPPDRFSMFHHAVANLRKILDGTPPLARHLAYSDLGTRRS